MSEMNTAEESMGTKSPKWAMQLAAGGSQGIVGAHATDLNCVVTYYEHYWNIETALQTE